MIDDDAHEPTRVYRVTLAIVDHDDIGEAELRRVIENTRYPNRCIYPRVVAVETREVQWHDGHPLNITSESRQAFAELFARDPQPDAPPAPRRPVAGWVENVLSRRLIGATGRVFACAYHSGAWMVDSMWGKADGIESAQLAAEDALSAVAREILVAVGRDA